MITITRSVPSLACDEKLCDPALATFIARFYTDLIDALLERPETFPRVLNRYLRELLPIEGCNLSMIQLAGEEDLHPGKPEAPSAMILQDWRLMEADEEGVGSTRTGTQLPRQTQKDAAIEESLQAGEERLIAVLQQRYQPEPVDLVLHWLLLGPNGTAACLFRVQRPSAEPRNFTPAECALLDSIAPYLARLLNLNIALMMQQSSYGFFVRRTMELAECYELTMAESRVLHQMITGADNATIAQTMGVGLATVKTHITHILGKLECRNRGALLGQYFSSIDLSSDSPFSRS